MQAPCDDLTRSVTFTMRDKTNGDGLTLEGYGAVFNNDTVIDSWEGNFVENIDPGAFKKTLRERTPVLQFDHGQHPLVGSLPLGAIEQLNEDAHGLFVSARLHDNWLVEPVRDAIRSGAISGMSFRFSVVKEKWADPTDTKSLPVRTIQEVKLYELGPVVFPAYTGTSVGVRSEISALAANPALLRELARALVFGTPAGAADPSEPQQHSDDQEEERTSDEAATAGTSDEAAPVEPQEHSTSAYSPTARPQPSRELFEQSAARARALAG
jgi:HK97 family phage prohead protease